MEEKEEIYYKIPAKTLRRLLHNVAAIDNFKRSHRKQYELLNNCASRAGITEVDDLLESFKDLIIL